KLHLQMSDYVQHLGCSSVNALSGLQKKCRKSLKTAPDTKTVFKGSLADAENTTSPQQVNPGTHIRYEMCVVVSTAK
ncbi:hypothetical protein, partial [Escherichia coli]|uniref:hypothetical protein n=1 Tax=Escherichia coli TaxID=562 RepID=UPI00345BF490